MKIWAPFLMYKGKIVIQGYPGSFHDEAVRKYFDQETALIPADSFDILANVIEEGRADYGMMAIENSIAGTLLQNYRILRERGFWIGGEVYLRIQHNLMVNPLSSLSRKTPHLVPGNSVSVPILRRPV